MREHEPTRLTNQASHPRLELGRNFMADGPRSPEQSEPPKSAEPQTTTTARILHGKIEEAKKAWVDLNRGRVVGIDEQRVIDEIVSRGISPKEIPSEKVEEAKNAWAKVNVDPYEGGEKQVEDLIRMGISPDDYFKNYGLDAQTAALTGHAGPGAMGAPPGPPTAESVFEKLAYRTFEDPEKVLFLTDRNARNAFFNKFFDLVNATPHEEFRSVFSADFVKSSGYQSFMDIMESASMGYFGTVQPLVQSSLVGTGVTLPDLSRQLAEDFYRYQKLRTMRENMHNIRIILFIPSVDQEGLDKSLQQFDSEYGDIALRQPGVVAMKGIYIDLLEEQKMQNKGFLPPESITGKVSKDPIDGKVTQVEKGVAEIEAKRRFRARLAKGLIFTRDENGQNVPLTTADFDERQLQETYILATGMSLIDQRIISIASGSTLPEDTGQYMSPYLQDVLKSNAIFRHLLVKFQIYRNALAPLLYKPDEVLDKTFGFLKMWNPKKFHEIWEKFNDNPLSIGQSAKELFFIMKQNPFRSGDIWTFISWRANPKKEVESMLKAFATKGEGRMKGRWAAHYAGAPTPDVYDAFIKLPAYKVPPNTSPDREAEVKGRLERQMEIDWVAVHPGTPIPKRYQDYINEYGNWIGTGVRFEKLRGGLSRFNLKETIEEQKTRFKKDRDEGRRGLPGARTETKYEAKARKSAGKSALESLENAENLLKRMTEIQPQRLYSISPEIRKRINVALGFPEDAEMSQASMGTVTYKEAVARILDNLAMVELAWLKDREVILQSGRTFDHTRAPAGAPPIPDTAFSIDPYIDPTITDPAERILVRNFINTFANDWTNNKVDYISEFVPRRDYTHGWVLWAEDSPVDEFNFTTIGTTAGFARKARDNDTLKKAGDKLIELLGHIKNVNEPEELIEPMGKIWTDISMYDASKADAFMAELTEGLDKTFAGDWRINIPVVGEVGKRVLKWSYARLVFDRSSPLWTATTMRHFHNLLRKDQQFSPEQQKELNKNLPSSKAEVALDVGTTMTELIALAVMWYMISKILSGEKKR